MRKVSFIRSFIEKCNDISDSVRKPQEFRKQILVSLSKDHFIFSLTSMILEYIVKLNILNNFLFYA